MRFIITALLFLYQKTVSPDHGIFSYPQNEFFGGVYLLKRCRFFPSCSEYSRCALRQYGLFKAIMLSGARIIRCGPWSRGGYDPLLLENNK